MHKSLIALCAAILTLGQAASAQSLPDRQRQATMESHRIVSFGSRQQAGADSVRRLIEAFYMDQFRHFQDPEAPYFLFMSKDATLAMGMGGAVRMRAYFNGDGVVSTPALQPYLIPMHPDAASVRAFATTPSGTALFFRVIGINKAVGQYQIYIEANFKGYQSRGLHLKKAYAQLNDFTVGYAPSTFSDPAAQPPMIDAAGSANKYSNTAVLIRYMHRIRQSGWSMAVSAESPSVQVATVPDQTKVPDAWIPDGAAFVQYQWGPSEHVRLAGIVRALSYRDLLTATNHRRAGWGLMLSGTGHPADPLTLYAGVNYGNGYSGLGSDLQCDNYDLIPVPDTPGRLYAPASWGWHLGVQYNFTPALFTSVSASQCIYAPAHSPQPDDYHCGTMFTANLIWNLTPRIQAGVEYDWAQRRNFSGEHRHSYRIEAMAQFSF